MVIITHIIMKIDMYFMLLVMLKEFQVHIQVLYFLLTMMVV